MNISKKEVFIVCILFLLSLNAAYADETGCCSNPGAGDRACTNVRWVYRDAECCPNQDTNQNRQQFYNSQQNPTGPTDYNDCVNNFFFKEKDCGLVEACTLGCCCSELDGDPKPEAQCKGTGQIFHKGETNCNVLCPIPQCNDGHDNDENGCADFEGGDLGCTSPSDSEESGGSCSVEGAGCTNPAYVPEL
ncbi:hypothetical protein HYX05_00195, partial [Candidatus Woesearchaeota archaeon]|nr:hypothetical protein [Candidatus Woesearchaeota archaeon]